MQQELIYDRRATCDYATHNYNLSSGTCVDSILKTCLMPSKEPQLFSRQDVGKVRGRELLMNIWILTQFNSIIDMAIW